jgi:hypothetical protein
LATEAAGASPREPQAIDGIYAAEDAVAGDVYVLRDKGDGCVSDLAATSRACGSHG